MVPTFGLSSYHFLQVMCVYLFHELPETARRNAAFEFARVLKPGGIMVLADSCQLGDRPAKDKAKANGTFGDFNGNLSSFHDTCDLRSRALICPTNKMSSVCRTLLSELYCNGLGGSF